MHSGCAVLPRWPLFSPLCDNLDPKDDAPIAELEERQLVQVTEIVELPGKRWVRARLEKTHGWITLLTKYTGNRWAARVDEQHAEMPNGTHVARNSASSNGPGIYLRVRCVAVSPSASLLRPKEE
eukprot:TRINITY_DN40163_c0_g1_i1.p1 TRINITY_DN40163_c0_g1~~TRINITY_DN40163_c0_g1_i1.p1  ORF type:complete len:147 (-),score=16.50 TRINITY_DN40163_c0_g1_i1:340-714(-)